MICSKCKSNFKCEKENIDQCHCFNFNFTNKTKKIIREFYNDCLCNNCLNKFKQFENLEKKQIYLNKKIEFKEGIHYNIENSLWVFSEYYHYLRGSCCQNNCKECIYLYNT